MSANSVDASKILSLPQGGGALKGIGEKFSPDLHTGTGNLSIPIAIPPGRNGFQPQLSLNYSSGSGNGPWGLGWNLSVPMISRLTSKGIPRYDDSLDIFVLSGAEELIPVEKNKTGLLEWVRYRPRTEGLFASIIHFYNPVNDYWEVKTKDGLVSYYGTEGTKGNDNAIIADPEVSGQGNIFCWKLSKTMDPFRNVILYEYLRDKNTAGVHIYEQAYLSGIRYVDYIDPPATSTSFLAEVLFNYNKTVRTDKFSDYKPGFEVRTEWRCDKISVRSRQPGIFTSIKDYLFTYADEDAMVSARPLNGVSLLRQIAVAGYDDTGIAASELPPVEFSYSVFDPVNRRDLTPVTGTELPPVSINYPGFELVDITGDGLPDIVEVNGVIRYWANRGNGQFDRPRILNEAPMGLHTTDENVQFIDADGDGRIDLLWKTDTISGYFPVEQNAVWDKNAFRKYRHAPSFNFNDPEVKLLDLNGDGITDAIRSGSRMECFFNYADTGWSNKDFKNIPRRQLEDFPNISFSDPRIRLGDMTGDGMQDIVMMYDGNIEYWPNMGWGKWGKRIHMHGSPRFPYGYDPARILLGDIDGDGAADLVYVGDKEIWVWINKSGNEWSEAINIKGTPFFSDPGAIRLIDLKGTGIAGILWTTDIIKHGHPNFFFLDLTGSGKPYLLNGIDNNMGAITRIEYASSTEYYLKDAAHYTTRWQTYLPFPVQVIKKTIAIEVFSGNKMTSEFYYHHGYWDGVEREFRGFGMVEQMDTEDFETYNAGNPSLSGVKFEKFDTAANAGYFSPPVLTKTWFAQGATGATAKTFCEPDYSKEYWDGDENLFTPHPGLLASALSFSQKRDALRALRGAVLRTEIYALDNKVANGYNWSQCPYTVTEFQHTVQEIEPPSMLPERKRIFFPHIISERTTQWERGDDPLTQFEFTSFKDSTGNFDNYGRVLRMGAIAMPRRSIKRVAILGTIQPDETNILASFTAIEFAVPIVRSTYMYDRVSHTRNFELTNPQTVVESDQNDISLILREQLTAASNLFQTFLTAWNGWQPGQPVPASLHIIGHSINYYDGAAFVGHNVNNIQSFGALAKTETLVFDNAILRTAYGSHRPVYLGGAAAFPATVPANFQTSLGYHLQNDDAAGHHAGYYIDSVQNAYDFQLAATGVGLIIAIQDPLKNKTDIQFDKFNLLPVKVRDAAGLEVSSVNNYRVFQPAVINDPNQHKTTVKYSALGLPEKKYLTGNRNEGGSESKPELSFIYGFLDYRMTKNSPAPQPVYVHSLVREHHESDRVNDNVIEKREYTDGFGRLLQARDQAEDIHLGSPASVNGVLPADYGNTNTTAMITPVVYPPGSLPKVTVSGWQRYDNKGRVIEKYEPFFSAGYAYEPGTVRGEKAIMYYDPRGQVISTINPDGSEQNGFYGVIPNLATPAVFNPTAWESYSYDPNDNGGRTHAALSNPYRHHWNTPMNTICDALGRTICKIERNGNSNPSTDWHITRTAFDIKGNLLTVTDPLGRIAFVHVYDLINRPLSVNSIDAGFQTSVVDAMGKPVELRDSKGSIVVRLYDNLSRLTQIWASNNAAAPCTLRENIIYGAQSAVLAQQRNAIGKPMEHWDEAGIVRFTAYDFKGNLLAKERQVIKDSEVVNDWVADWVRDNPVAVCDSMIYQTDQQYDALSRIIQLTYPADVNSNRSIAQARYNKAGALEQVVLDGAVYAAHIAYNAKGQRTFIAYGNNIMTRYAYDPKTFRLVRLRTEKFQATAVNTYQPNGGLLQDQFYEYDLSGNILEITDRVPGSGFISNPDALKYQSANPSLSNQLNAGDALCRYFEYNPIYCLTKASGRESGSMAQPRPFNDYINDGYDSGNHGTANQDNAPNLAIGYTEEYKYDPSGNMLELKHTSQGRSPWTRNFGMAGFTAQSWLAQINAHLNTNAAWSVVAGNQLTHAGNNNPITPQSLQYDPSGNLISENTDRHYYWDHANRLIHFEVRPAGSSVASVKARYLYGTDGMRVKKWVRKNGINNNDASTVYIDANMEHHQWKENTVAKRNNYLHIMDNKSRIASVRIGNIYANETGPSVQYQLSDHLQSSCVVVGGNTSQGNTFVNREEYLPYGETSFGSFGKKKYRYSGKERDEESGLYYYGYRYYQSYSGKWLSCDLLYKADGNNLYLFLKDNPFFYQDKLGDQEETADSFVEPKIHLVVVGTDDPVKKDAGGHGHQLGDLSFSRHAAKVLSEHTELEDFPSRVGSNDQIIVFVPKSISRVAENRLRESGKKYKEAFTIKKIDEKDLGAAITGFKNVKTLLYFGHGEEGIGKGCGPMFDWGPDSNFPAPSKFKPSQFTPDAIAIFITCNSYEYAREFTKETFVKTIAVTETTYWDVEIVRQGKDETRLNPSGRNISIDKSRYGEVVEESFYVKEKPFAKVKK